MFVYDLPQTAPEVTPDLLLKLSGITDLVVGAASAVGAGIALIRYEYLRTSIALSCLQVIVGGGLVFAADVLIGQS